MAQDTAPPVLGAWLEPLLSGRRIALLGDSSSGLGERLASASGRRVHVYDPDRERTSATLARRGRESHVICAPFEEVSEAHDHAFDAVVIDDLASFRDSAALLSQAQSLVSARGLLLVATENPAVRPGGPGYYDLYDLVSERFAEVRMLGLAPFNGCTIADFSAGSDVGVTIDSSLVERSEEPTHFLALASERELDIDPYVLVQLPFLPAAPSRAADESFREELASLRAELDKVRQHDAENTRLAEERRRSATLASARAAELETRCQALNDGLERVREEIAKEKSRHADERQRLEDQFQEELDTMLERIAELEEEAATVEIEPAAVTAPSTDAHRGFEFQIEELKKALAEARSERTALQAPAARAVELERELGELRERYEQARLRADAATRQVAQDDLVREHESEVSRFELLLGERAKVVDDLRGELRESERIGRELTRELSEQRKSNGSGTESGGGKKDEQLDALLQKCSRYEADLQAANWKIAALSSQIDESAETESDHQALEDALRQTQAELAELKRRI
ncbi:MAG TPA: hypothetical protein VFB62_06975 [Polyangiaceae bacterium]|jgi:chromosome segregation ATPase|nr:hypothetical protein [Polyangiaceae bacterium]